MKKLIHIILLFLSVVSCDLFKSEPPQNPIARVNDDYLYMDDIKDLVPKGTNTTDSILRVNDYINRWARQKLLMQGALVNLSEEKQEEFSSMVNQYKSDLYTKAYLEALIKKSIDTLVTKNDAKKFYELNKESFKLNENLLKFRYISLPENSINLDNIKKHFTQFNPEDKTYLDSIAVQFNSYYLNDSTWVKVSDVSNKIPVINNDNKTELLKKTNFIQLKDSLNLYLISIKDVLEQGSYAPLEYISPSIKKIVINKRKLSLIKQLENDIIKDAIKNNQFQTYK